MNLHNLETLRKTRRLDEMKVSNHPLFGEYDREFGYVATLPAGFCSILGREFSLPSWEATRSSFSSFCNRFIRYSSWRASDLLGFSENQTSCTGNLDRVYLAAVPALCASRRRSRSVVIPQYRVLSEHRRKYTNQDITLSLF